MQRSLASTSPPNKATILSFVVLFLSLTAHGVLLILPMPSDRPSESLPEAVSESANGELSVVVLSEKPSTLDEATVAEPTSEAATVAPASPSVPPVPVEPPVARPSPVPAAVPLAPDMTAGSPEPAIEDLPQLAETEPLPVFEPPVDALNETVQSPSVEPLVSYAVTFPHFEGAEDGCFGVSECRRVNGAGTYRSVARSLVTDLEAQGYTVTLRDDLEDTGRNVYELLPPDETTLQYLLVFSDLDGSAIYVMSQEIMTLDDLQALQTQAVTEPNLG